MLQAVSLPLSPRGLLRGLVPAFCHPELHGHRRLWANPLLYLQAALGCPPGRRQGAGIACFSSLTALGADVWKGPVMHFCFARCLANTIFSVFDCECGVLP